MRFSRLIRSRTAIVALCAAALLPSAGTGQGITVPRLPFTKFVMKNGLTVLLAENHAAPTVSLWMVYRVGQKDYDPGKSGFAHLFEHMMFEGSANVAPGEHAKILAAA
jgi:zinc protease